MLVQTPGAKGVPGVQLCGNAQVDEPVVLQCLPEVAGRVGRNVPANLGNPLELCLSVWIGLLDSQILGALGMALGKADQRPSADSHRFEFFLP